MTTGVVACEPETPLREVAQLLASRRIHAVYVFDAAGRWGLVSDLDLVAAARADLATMTARDVAVTPFVTVCDDDTLDRAAQLLAENGVSHLAVVAAHPARPVGVLSTLDVARAVAVAQCLTAKRPQKPGSARGDTGTASGPADSSRTASFPASTPRNGAR